MFGGVILSDFKSRRTLRKQYLPRRQQVLSTGPFAITPASAATRTFREIPHDLKVIRDDMAQSVLLRPLWFYCADCSWFTSRLTVVTS